MILPKDFFNEIQYWDHTVEVNSRTQAAWDIFHIHFKKWWKPKRIIKIYRIVNVSPILESFTHSPTKSAVELYSQLNNWAIETWDEKLDSVKQKYEPPKDGSNVITLKQKPKDMDDE